MTAFLSVVAATVIAIVSLYFKCIVEDNGRNVWNHFELGRVNIPYPATNRAGKIIGVFFLIAFSFSLFTTWESEQEKKKQKEDLENTRKDLEKANEKIKMIDTNTQATKTIVEMIDGQVKAKLPKFIEEVLNDSKDNIKKGIEKAIIASQGKIEDSVDKAVVDFQRKVTTTVDEKVSESQTRITAFVGKKVEGSQRDITKFVGEKVQNSQEDLTKFVKGKVDESQKSIENFTRQIVDAGIDKSVNSVAIATNNIGGVIMGLPLRFEQKMPPRRLTGPLSDLLLEVGDVSDDDPFEVHVLRAFDGTHIACETIKYDKKKNERAIYFKHPATNRNYKITLTIIPKKGFWGIGGMDYLIAQSIEDDGKESRTKDCKTGQNTVTKPRVADTSARITLTK